jgi:hypothetical protein
MSDSLTIEEAVKESLSDCNRCFLYPLDCAVADPFCDDLQAQCGSCQVFWVALAEVLQCAVCGRFIGRCCAASLVEKSRRSAVPERRGVLVCEPCSSNRASRIADRIAGCVRALVCVVETPGFSCAAWVRTALIEALAVGTAIVLERPLHSDWMESLGGVLRNPRSILPENAAICERLRIFVVVSLAAVTRSTHLVFDDLHAFISSVSTPDGECDFYVFVLAAHFGDESVRPSFEASRVAFEREHANLHVLFVTTDNSSEVMRLAAVGVMTSMITNALTPPLAADTEYVAGPVFTFRPNAPPTMRTTIASHNY